MGDDILYIWKIFWDLVLNIGDQVNVFVDKVQEWSVKLRNLVKINCYLTAGRKIPKGVFSLSSDVWTDQSIPDAC